MHYEYFTVYKQFYVVLCINPLRVFFHCEAVWMKEIFINKNMHGYVSMTLHFGFFNSSQLSTEYFFQLQEETPQDFSTTDKQNSPCDLNVKLQIVNYFFHFFSPLLQVCANTVCKIAIEYFLQLLLHLLFSQLSYLPSLLFLSHPLISAEEIEGH